MDRDKRLTQASVRELLIQMAGALAEAHAHNIVHRDIKLSNILVDRSGPRPRFVLTDFGVGRTAEGIQAEKHTGGTYLFMAPEQLRGRPGPQSDLWALGVVAYRLLTGQMPFNGANLHELSSQIFYAVPAPPSKVMARPIDADLEAAVFHLLEKSLSDRTASAEELLRELGYKGKPAAVAAGPAAAKAAPKSAEVLDRRNERQMVRLRVLIAIFTTLYIFQKGLFSGVLLLGGVICFYLGCRRDRRQVGQRVALIAASFLGMGGAALLPYTSWEVTPILAFGWFMNWGGEAAAALSEATGVSLNLGVLGIALVVIYLGLAFLSSPLAANFLAALRRRQRTRALRRAVLEAGDDADHYVRALKTFLDDRIEDVAFHLKYIEALLARGRLKEVAVEAILLLEQDPCNFNGNLLLANAYAALGLPEDCVAVCDAYLSVAGYCFEFSELRQRCLSLRRV